MAFFYGIDITQRGIIRDIGAVVTYALSGPEPLVSALKNLLSSPNSNAIMIRSGIAEFSHNEGVLEFLTERNLSIKLGIGIVLLQDKTILGQCIRFTD